VATALSQLQWGSVDDVPALWMERATGFTAGISFRVGSADERPGWRGLTHLLQHLVLESLGRDRIHANANIGPLFTSFYSTSDEDLASDFIQHVLRSLARLNAGRLGTEAREVADELSMVGRPSLEDVLFRRRFGATGVGRVGLPELAVHHAEPQHVAAWASTRFSRHNAAFWFAGAPPRWLEMPLVNGQWHPAPPSDPIEWLPLPGVASFEGEGVGVSMILPTGPAAAFGVHVLDRRARGLVDRGLCQRVAIRAKPIALDRTHVAVVVDCESQMVPKVASALIDLIDDLSRNEVSPSELNEWLIVSETTLRDPARAVDVARTEAHRLLLGGDPRDPEQQLDDRRKVRTVDATAEISRATATLLMLLPTAVRWSDARLARVPDGPKDEIEGKKLTARNGDHSGRAFTLGLEAVSFVPIKGAPAQTVHYADCEQMLIEGDGTRTLIARDGTIVHVDPGEWKESDAITTLLDNSIPADRRVRFARPIS
jgi:zinc protease